MKLAECPTAGKQQSPHSNSHLARSRVAHTFCSSQEPPVAVTIRSFSAGVTEKFPKLNASTSPPQPSLLILEAGILFP